VCGYYNIIVLFKEIPGNAVVIPGHGENTTIEKEKKYNAILYEDEVDIFAILYKLTS
jgi:hypothetical protein